MNIAALTNAGPVENPVLRERMGRGVGVPADTGSAP